MLLLIWSFKKEGEILKETLSKDMKVQGKERIAFNFKDLLKSFISNDVTNAEDKEVEEEVKKIIEQQDNPYIKKLEKSTEYNVKIKSDKRNKKINLETAKTQQVERNSVVEGKTEEKERD